MVGSYQVSSGEPQDWHFGLRSHSVKSIALLGFVALAVLDLSLANINWTALFAVPTLLLASRVSRIRDVWWYVILLVVAIYALYVVKYTLVHKQDIAWLLNYRLFNRTFAAFSIFLLGLATQAWLYWQNERSLLTYLDRSDEDEVNATAGLVGCIGLGLLITAIDFVSPANLNLPILFAVPLYLVSWLRDRRSLWITTILFIALTWVGYFVMFPATVVGIETYLIINRTLVTLALILMAIIMDWQLSRLAIERPASELR